MFARKESGILLAFALAALPLAFISRAPQSAHSKAAGLAPTPDSKSNARSMSAAPSDASAAKLSDFGWLEGRWRGEWGPRVAEQVWFSPKAGVMEGMFRLLEADKTLVIEFFTLVQKADGITFYFRHFTPNLVPWEKSDATVLKLASVDGKASSFENPVNGMPKSLTFTRMDPDTYLTHSELVPETGDPQVIEITYKRQPGVVPGASGGSGARQKKP